MFTGEYNHSIDPKNRIIIPAKFREGLGDKFVITAGLGGCLYLCTYEDFEKYAKKLESLPFKKETRDFQRYFARNTAEVEIDKQGRVLLPANLKALAHIEKDVVFIGDLNKVELWAKETVDSSMPDAPIEDIAERLSVEYDLGF